MSPRPSPGAVARWLLAATACGPAFAAETFLRPNDVVAMVGGEEMVAASEHGYIEYLLTRAHPKHRLKFRCLAWEGDTVYEMRRDLNYPSLEQQLDRFGATVIIAQFGLMESLGGPAALADFTARYDALLEKWSAGGKRRIWVIPPKGPQWDARWHGVPVSPEERFGSFLDYAAATEKLAIKWRSPRSQGQLAIEDARARRDGIHANVLGHWLSAFSEFGETTASTDPQAAWNAMQSAPPSILQAIRKKHRLWEHYRRPQNWAFLAGDRTSQPSSRDHRDPSKRWFPAELEQFVPLIEAQEQEIWRLADQ